MSGQLSCPRPLVVALVLLRVRRAMAPHLSGSELDVVTKAVREGKTSSEILGLNSRSRRKLKVPAPKVWAIRSLV